MDGCCMDFWSPIRLSLQITVASSIIAFLLALTAAALLRRHSFRGKSALETLFFLPMVLPPTVVGFLLLIVLGRQSWIGKAFEYVFNAPIVFSAAAAIIASTIVAFPLVYQSCKAGFASIDAGIQDAARSEGASEWQVLRYIALPLTSRFMWSGYLLGFVRGLGEFGATLMIAGNIPGKTQTVPTAIYVAVESGRTAEAWLYAAMVILFSFVLVWLTNRMTK